MPDERTRELRDALLDVAGRGAEHPFDDAAFDDHARRVFTYQYERVPAYGAYCRARGRTPDSVRRWTEIPAVPTAAFKALTLLADGLEARAVFRTSGTTRGAASRGAHHVADLDLYRGSLRPTFQAFLLPDRPALRFLSLMPPARVMPDSSLAFMIEDVMAAFGAPGSRSFADAGGIDFDALDRSVGSAVAGDLPLLLLGTSAAFIHWLDRLEARDLRHHLPAGSRLMDTGGFKGAGRRVPPAELRRRYEDRLGLTAHACVNEYGMTEMLSQMYDTVLRDPAPGKRGPAWLRSLAVDPETLEPLPHGSSGLLRHVDLANIGSVAAVQTEDVGRVDADGRLFLEGRAAGAEPRGCSIAMDTLLRSVE